MGGQISEINSETSNRATTYLDEDQFLNGVDNRKQVASNIHKFPYSSIGVLKIRQDKLISHGTAFLIAGNLILTSAYNIGNKNIQEMHFYPGVSEKAENGFRIINWKIKKQFQEAFKDNKNNFQNICEANKAILKKYDFALLKLQRSVRDDDNYIQLSYDSVQDQQNIQIYGYPLDKMSSNKNSQLKYRQYGCQGRSSHTKDNIIYYKIDATEGQSGSPLMTVRDGKLKAIGIHKGRSDQIFFKAKNNFNFGLLFTKETIDQLYIWQGEMNVGIKVSKCRQKYQPQPVKPIIQVLQQNIHKIIPITFHFNWDTSTPYMNKFQINKKQIKKIANDKSTYQVTSKQSFLKTGVQTVNFKFGNYDGMFIGIITESKKQKQFTGWADSKQALAYLSSYDRKGSLWVDTKNIIKYDYNSLGAVPGGQIEMKVDFNNWTVTFTRKINSKQSQMKITETGLPTCFKDKKLFVFVSMWGFRDIVDLL